MLSYSIMKSKVYSFGRFYDPAQVQAALDVLLAAGIPRSQIHVLKSPPENERSNINSPEQKALTFRGICGGALAGLVGGIIVFILPAFLFYYPFEREMAIIGTFLSIVVGISIGILRAYGMARRRSGDHVVRANEQGIFVTIQDGQADRLEMAKMKFNRLQFAN